jgi:hypothetical protein
LNEQDSLTRAEEFSKEPSRKRKTSGPSGVFRFDSPEPEPEQAKSSSTSTTSSTSDSTPKKKRRKEMRTSDESPARGSASGSSSGSPSPVKSAERKPAVVKPTTHQRKLKRIKEQVKITERDVRVMRDTFLERAMAGM